MSRIILSLLFSGLLVILGGLAAVWGYHHILLRSGGDRLPLTESGYIIETLDTASAERKPQYKLPDLSIYTVEAIQNKIPQTTETGIVDILPFAQIQDIQKFNESKSLPQFQELQGRKEPLAIHIKNGVYDFESLTKAVNNPDYIEQTSASIYLVKIPIVVSYGATLIIRDGNGNRPTLRLSTLSGAFLVNAGQLFILNANIFGWDESNDNFAEYQDEKIFRPFFAAWNGSQTYFARSHFKDLGYAGSKGYGISFSRDKTLSKNFPEREAPTGWLVECIFEAMHYAFYSYEAKDVVLIRNTYKDNIIYGIDPHDRSTGLIIAYNEVYGTKVKHGIIGSREVNDSFIIGNYSHHNHSAGFMLDRSSVRNVVVDNISEYNGADGLTLFESEDNIIANNTIRYNGKNGIRIRNSWNVETHGNQIYGNKGVGIQLYALNIITDPTRDFTLDPFTAKAGISMVDDTIAFNEGGLLKFGWFEKATFDGVQLIMPFNGSLREDLSDIASPFISAYLLNGQRIALTRDPAAGKMQIPFYEHESKSEQKADAASRLEAERE